MGEIVSNEFILDINKQTEPIVPVSSIALNKTNLTLSLGSIEKLTATISPINATNKEIIWSNNNAEVISVTKDGTIIPRGSGSAIVIVKTIDGDIYAICNVTVTDVILPNTVFELNSTDYINGTTTWRDKYGKIANLSNSIEKIENRVRFKGDNNLICDVSALNLTSYTMIVKLIINPMDIESGPQSGNKIFNLGTGYSNWADNMSCGIYPQWGNTTFTSHGTKTDVQSEVQIGEQIITFRFDSTTKNISMTVGNKKYIGTSEVVSSDLNTLFLSNESLNDYSYIKIYDSVFTDEQVNAVINKDFFIPDKDGKFNSGYNVFEFNQFYRDKLNGNKIILFGDSLMSGDYNNGKSWGYYIDKYYGTTSTNYAKGGATVILPTDFPGLVKTQIQNTVIEGTELVLLNGGINDCWKHENGGASAVDTIVEGIEECINLLLNKGIQKENLVFILPAGFTSNNVINYYNKTISKLKSLGIKYVELYKYIATSHTLDGVHYNESGYMATINQIAKSI